MTTPAEIEERFGSKLWEPKSVTVCIAAVCGFPPTTVILCSDRLWSSSLGTSDNAFKLRHLPKDWWCLFAGTDRDAFGLINAVHAQFAEAKEIDETNVIPLVQGAIAARKRELAQDITGARFGLSYDDFLKRGKQELPSDIFGRVSGEIERIDLGASLILVGTRSIATTLIQVSRDGDVWIRENFAVIGEGSHLAQSSLMQREYHEFLSVEKALYFVFEAKKHAERVSSVGKTTVLRVKDEAHDYIAGDKHLEQLTVAFEKYGPQKVPDVPVAEKFLESMSDLNRGLGSVKTAE